MKRIIPLIVSFVLVGCNTGTTNRSSGPSAPMLMVMTVNEHGWYRCVAMKMQNEAVFDWVISPTGAISEKDEIRISRKISVNQFDALFALIENDPRLIPWKRTDNGTRTLDHGLLISLKPQGASSKIGSTYDIDPKPESSILIEDLRRMLGFDEIKEIGIKK